MSLQRTDGSPLASPLAVAGLDLETLRLNLAPEAQDQDLRYFALVCRHLDLDPFAGHIYLIGRKQKFTEKQGNANVVKWEKVFKPQISVAGRRAIASRTGRLQGIDGPYWCGPRRYAPDGSKLPLDWQEVWDDEIEVDPETGEELALDHPYAARCLVWPAGWKTPANGTVKWSEFAVGVRDDEEEGGMGFMWKKAPSHMIGKVAECLALRRGFPEVQAALAYVNQTGDADDVTMMAEASAPEIVPTSVERPPAPDAGTEPASAAHQDHRSGEPATPAGAGRSLPRSPAPSSAPPRSPSPPAGARRRHPDDGPPPEYYDNLPEAQGR